MTYKTSHRGKGKYGDDLDEKKRKRSEEKGRGKGQRKRAEEKGRGKGQRKRATEVCEAVRGTELLATIGLSLENVMDA